MAREFRETPQTNRPNARAPGGRMSKANDLAVDLRLAMHTLENAKDKLTAIGAVQSPSELRRVRIDIESDIALAQRAIDGVAGRLK